jgi:hypothetical protein
MDKSKYRHFPLARSDVLNNELLHEKNQPTVNPSKMPFKQASMLTILFKISIVQDFGKVKF